MKINCLPLVALLFIYVVLFNLEQTSLNIISLPHILPKLIFHKAGGQTSSNVLIRKQGLVKVDTVTRGVKYTLKISDPWL